MLLIFRPLSKFGTLPNLLNGAIGFWPPGLTKSLFGCVCKASIFIDILFMIHSLMSLRKACYFSLWFDPVSLQASGSCFTAVLGVTCWFLGGWSWIRVVFAILRRVSARWTQCLKESLKHRLLKERKQFFLVVPNPLVVGGTIYSNGFFCSDNFGQSIYSS